MLVRMHIAYVCVRFERTRVRGNINIYMYVVYGGSREMVGRVRVYRSIGGQKADPAKSSAASCALSNEDVVGV